MNKTISLIAMLGALVSGTVFADVKQGFTVENPTPNTLWVNVGDAPAKSKESLINLRGYKVINAGETKRWSYILGNLQKIWDPETTKLWIRTADSQTAYGFTFPILQSINKLKIQSPNYILLTGKKVDWLAAQPKEETTPITGQAEDVE